MKAGVKNPVSPGRIAAAERRVFQEKIEFFGKFYKDKKRGFKDFAHLAELVHGQKFSGIGLVTREEGTTLVGCKLPSCTALVADGFLVLGKFRVPFADVHTVVFHPEVAFSKLGRKTVDRLYAFAKKLSLPPGRKRLKLLVKAEAVRSRKDSIRGLVKLLHGQKLPKIGLVRYEERKGFPRHTECLHPKCVEPVSRDVFVLGKDKIPFSDIHVISEHLELVPKLSKTVEKVYSLFEFLSSEKGQKILDKLKFQQKE